MKWIFCFLFCCAFASYEEFYKKAKEFEENNSWDEALYWYLEAFQENSLKGEPLKRIAMHYRLQGANDLAYLFAKFGTRLVGSEHLFEEELSIVAYYTPFKKDGYQAAGNLILRKHFPYYVRDQTYRNLLFYVEPLEAEYLALPFDPPPSWNPMNPSILKTKEGYKVICRVVNYTQKGAKDFKTKDPSGIFRSRNFILEYDQNFSLTSSQEIIETKERIRTCSPLVQGLEDCRMIEWKKKVMFTCTTTDTNPTGNLQISLCNLGDGQIESLIPLIGPDLNRCEKNWLPFIHEEKPLFIYSYDPFVIYTLNGKTGELKTFLKKEPKNNDFSSFRGSAGPIPFDQGYLILIHEIAYLQEWERVYLHRFLYLNADFEITKATLPFIFRQQGVEFCTGMCWNHAENKILLGLGIEDSEAWICSIDKSRLFSLLKNLP